jgi:4'-phosphopantetheinyl transferase
MVTLGALRGNPQLLGADEVHVWYALLDTITWDDDEINRLLSAEEKRKAAGFVFALDRKRYALGRAILKIIISDCLSVQPERISFRYNQYGKPELQDSDISFNMSKSAGRAIFALTRNRSVGVDIEHIRDIPQMAQVARRFFSKSENESLCTYPEDILKKKFFLFWTRKEALVKAIGEGLNIPLDSFDVSGNVDEPIHLMRLEHDLAKGREWGICNLELDDEYASAMAVGLPCSLPPQIHFFR